MNASKNSERSRINRICTDSDDNLIDTSVDAPRPDISRPFCTSNEQHISNVNGSKFLSGAHLGYRLGPP